VPELSQFLVDENPYGYMNSAVDLNALLNYVIAELTMLRDAPNPEEMLKNLYFVDGISAKRKKDDPAPPAYDYDTFMKGLFWQFKGKVVRVSKAIKLEYPINGQGHSILIGYTGSGGGM
jgi:hypothetical protein